MQLTSRSRPEPNTPQNNTDRTEYELQRYLQGFKACPVIPPGDIVRFAMNEFGHILTIEAIIGNMAVQGLMVDELTLRSYQAVYGNSSSEAEDEEPD